MTDRDLWIEDPSSTLYNRHLILSAHEPFPPEHSYHLMRQDDPAHSLKLFIRHNAPPDTKPGSGSAIFSTFADRRTRLPQAALPWMSSLFENC